MAEQHFIGIDIGSTKLGLAVASSDPAGGLRYLGHETLPISGAVHGAIVDQAAFSSVFGDALQAARGIAGRPVADVVVSLNSWLVNAAVNQGQIDVDTGYPIYQPDVDRVVSAARVEDPSGYQLIHRAVQGFAVNGERMLNPLGRVGQSLHVWVRDFSIPTTLAEGLREAAAAYNARIHAMVPAAIASGEAVLRPDERERGVILLDLGGSLTEVAIYTDGVLYDLTGFDQGSLQITQDLAAVLDLPPDVAEQVKARHGVGSMKTIERLEVDWTPRGIARLQREAREGTLRRDVPRAIAGARYEQIIGQVRSYLANTATGLQFHAGVVITGGASRMPGVEDVTRELLQLEVRCGSVLGSDGFPPISDISSSAAIGLVRYCGLRARSGVAPAPRRQQARQLPAGHLSWGSDTERGVGAANGNRQWGRTMKDWMRGFIPARTDV